MNAPKNISFIQRYHSQILQHQRAFAESFTQLWKTPVATFITLGVIALVMALPLGLFWASINIDSVTSQWNKGGELTLFLQDNLSEQKVRDLRNRIAMKPEIRRVDYHSPQQALSEFQAMTNMGDVMDALDSNPLPGIMIIEPVYAEVKDLQRLKAEFSKFPEVAMAQLDIAWVERLNAVLRMLDQLIITLAVLLSLGLLFVVGNTTRTAITQRQEEILVAKLVGASDAYVCRPFLYTGLWYGLLGSALSLLVLVAVGFSLSPALDGLLRSYQSQWQPEFLNFVAIFSTILFAIALSMFGAWLAVRRYLYQIEAR